MRERKVFRLMAKPANNDLFDPITEKPLLEHAYKMGYDTFMAYRRYCENPFNPNDWQRSDAWDEGWAAAERDHPGRFDHSNNRFIYNLPYIRGNPSCPF